MAFSFDTFAKDQKQSAIDIVDTITPSQVKQVGAAYKAGLNASPKQVINETLESFTGIDLSQGAGVDGLGAQAKNFIEGQAADLTMQLEQQILGCINTAIRDLMNKVPAVDFILNFEDRINGILGKFRNKLESKIDAELRKLTYQKIKVHQVALFKQRIRGKIKDICPAATPASVAEVQDFNNKIKGFISKRSADNTALDTAKTLTTDKINEAKVEVKTQVATADNSISNKRKQTFQQDPVETKKIVDEKVSQATAEVKQETEDQLEKKEDGTIEALVNVIPTEEDIFKPFEWENHRWLYFGHLASVPSAQLRDYDSAVVKRMVDNMFEGLVGVRNFKEYVDTGIDHTKNKALKKAMTDATAASRREVLHDPESTLFASLWFEPLSYDNDILNVNWFFRLELGSTEKEWNLGVLQKAKPAEVILNVSRKATVSNSSPTAAIYEAQKQVKAAMIEFIHRTPFYRGGEQAMTTTEFNKTLKG